MSRLSKSWRRTGGIGGARSRLLAGASPSVPAKATSDSSTSPIGRIAGRSAGLPLPRRRNASASERQARRLGKSTVTALNPSTAAPWRRTISAASESRNAAPGGTVNTLAWLT